MLRFIALHENRLQILLCCIPLKPQSFLNLRLSSGLNVSKAQARWQTDGAIGLLPVFDERKNDACHGNGGAIEHVKVGIQRLG